MTTLRALRLSQIAAMAVTDLLPQLMSREAEIEDAIAYALDRRFEMERDREAAERLAAAKAAREKAAHIRKLRAQRDAERAAARRRRELRAKGRSS